MTAPEPMTDERLAEIEASYEPLRGDHGDHVRELIAEIKRLRAEPCRAEFVVPGQDERAALHVCRGRVGHEGMHSDGTAAWGDGAALDNHPAEALLLRVSELVAAYREVRRHVDGYARGYSVLWEALREIREGIGQEKAEPATPYAAVLDGIAGVIDAIPEWARPHA